MTRADGQMGITEAREGRFEAIFPDGKSAADFLARVTGGEFWVTGELRSGICPNPDCWQFGKAQDVPPPVPQDFRSSYASPWTAIGRAREAMASRRVRCPESVIVITHRPTGTEIWRWDGGDAEFTEMSTHELCELDRSW